MDEVNLVEGFKNLKEKLEMVFAYENELKVISGPTMKIKLLKNVRVGPIHVNTPRRTAYVHQKAAKVELDRLICLGVLEKVEGGSE